MNPHRIRAYIYLLLINAIWGIAIVVIKLTLSGFDPATFLLYRFAISSLLAVLTIPFIKLTLPKNPRLLLLLLVHAFLNSTIALGLLFLGMDKTTAISTTIITSTAPLFIALAGVKIFHEHLTRRELVGISIAFMGTLITVIEPLLNNHDGLSGLTGNILIFLSLMIGIVTTITGKFLVRNDVKPISITNLTFIVGLLTMLPFAFITSSTSDILNKIATTPIQFHLGVIFMAVVSGNLAYFLWAKASKMIEIGEATVFSYLGPLFAAPLSVIILKEKVTSPFIFGAVIIAVGVGIAEYKKYKSN